LGATGVVLARYCRALGMAVTAYRRRDMPSEVEGVTVHSQARGDDLKTSAKDADFLVLCASLNDQNYRFVGRAEIAAMKRGGFLVNIARHQLVDETAMLDALKSGQLGGAGLDVTDPEEPLPPWSPLWSAPNMILTPHMTPQMPDRTARTLDLLA